MIDRKQIVSAKDMAISRYVWTDEGRCNTASAGSYGTGFMDGATWALEQDTGNDPAEHMPEPGKLVLTTDGKGWHLCRYFPKGHEEIELDDGDIKDHECEEINGKVYMKEGWYEEAEQHSGSYDWIYIKREVTRWWPLPTKP